MQLANGTTLHGGAYRIIESLGRGSFGITYLAEHTALGKKVCIKEFFMKELNSRSDDGSIIGLSNGSLSYYYAQKFRKEAQNLARMDHPNIVSVTDCFDENGTFYYVMEYIEGQDLNRYLKWHSMTEAEAVSIISDVADALIYMHEEKRMLHLDLKPGNVMRRSNGHIFLIDFGLSKHYGTDGKPETSTTIGLGTEGYAPIEQSNQAKNGEFRPTIDVYALGATLYKLLTRQTPPPASELVSDEGLLRDEMQKKGVSEGLISVVEKAMTPNVRKRTQTVRDFKNSLNAGVDSVVFGGNTAVVREENIITEDESTELLAQACSSSEKEDLELLHRAAERGGAEAMCKLGECYYYGNGVDEDDSKAVELFCKSADLGNSRAMCNLGVCYENGNGVSEDKAKAVEWYRKSADLGNSRAMCNLGVCYEDGNGVSEDKTKAVEWYRKSAAFGNARAMCHLGNCYEKGNGVTEDKAKAVEWYYKSADLGNSDAKEALKNARKKGGFLDLIKRLFG